MSVHIGELSTDVVARSATGTSDGARTGLGRGDTADAADPWWLRDEMIAALRDAERRRCRLRAVDHDD